MTTYFLVILIYVAIGIPIALGFFYKEVASKRELNTYGDLIDGLKEEGFYFSGFLLSILAWPLLITVLAVYLIGATFSAINSFFGNLKWTHLRDKPLPFKKVSKKD